MHAVQSSSRLGETHGVSPPACHRVKKCHTRTIANQLIGSSDGLMYPNILRVSLWIYYVHSCV